MRGRNVVWKEEEGRKEIAREKVKKGGIDT